MPLHQYTPGVKVPSGLEPVNPIPVDSWSGPYAAGSTTAAVASANSTIPASLRFLSLEVRILAPDPDNAGQTLAYKYWYRGSTADSGLVEFSSTGTSITDYVTTFNGRTGAVQGVSAAVAGDGISVSGATGSVTFTNTGVTRAAAGTGIFVSANTGTVTITNIGVQSFNGLTGAVQGVSSWNGQTGAVSFVDYVSSFNGKTGAVTGASLGANTFTQLNTFSAGISTNGATLSGTVTATTRPIGTNDTTLATTAFVQNEIVADTVTTFNGRTGAVQGVSAAVAGDGISVSGATGSVTFTNTGVTRAAAGTGIFVSANTGTVTITNIGVQSFNGNTGAVTGASLGANTFTELNTFNGGITTAFIYASTGSTFGGTLRVVGGTTLSGRVDVGGVLDVVGGTTLESTLDVGGVARFAAGITTTTLDASQAIRANGGLTASTFDVTGTSRFAQGVTLSGRVDVGGVLDVVSGTTLESTLDVAGVARFASGVTFSALSTFTNGITASYLYASTGSTFGSTIQVSGGATLAGRVDIGGVLDVVGGTTLESTLDVAGVARFASGITVSGAARFAAGITASSVDVTGVLKANGGLTASTLDVTGVSRFAGGATFSSSADFAGAARFAVGLTSSGDVVVGSAGTVFKSGGDATIGATLTVNGNFYVQGTVTTVNRTDLAVDDKIITIGRTLESDSLADGGGLVLKGSSDRTLTWSDSADAWTSNDNFNVGSVYGYKVNNTTVLASGMIHGLSASAGSISGGTWAANLIGLTYGGTNKNLVSVGASGGVVFKDGTGLSITAAGTNGQILQANASGAPTWVNLTTLTGLTADSVKITDRDITAGTVYLTFTTDAGNAMSLFIDKSSGVTYDASTNTLSCTKLEAMVDGGVF